MPEYRIELTDEIGRNLAYTSKWIPTSCPICHQGIDVRIKTGFAQDTRAEVIFQCPRSECRRCFIGRYSIFQGSLISPSVVPIVPSVPKHSQEIKEVSEGFCEIYDQAWIAEEGELTQIAGAGYRKALEFLIKDYVTRGVEEIKREEIKAKFLGAVIKHDLKSENIQKTAERATWLGNDETHYVRRWTEMDIDDLKTLIKLTVTWIETEELTKLYLEKMKD